MYMFICPTISAILTALPFYFQKLWPIIFLSLIPFLYYLMKNKLSKSKAFLYGFIYGFIFYLLASHWLWYLYPLTNFGFNKLSSFFIILGCWLFISIYEGALFSLISFLLNILNLGTIQKAFFISSLWTFLEWFQGLGPLGFPWFTLSLPLTNCPFLIQIACVFGSLFISFFIVFINCIFSIIIFNKNYRKKSLTILCISVIFITIGNYICLNIGNDKYTTIDYSIIQGNVSSYNKIKEKFVKNNLDTYLSLTNESFKDNPNIQLVIWPEIAVPIYLNKNEDVYNLYKEIAIKNKSNLLVGAFTFSDFKKYNALYCFNPDGNVSGIYRKGHLVPFGEFIPFSNMIFKTFPKLKELKAFSDNLQGDESTPTIKASFGTIGPFICFESVFSDIPKSEIKKGAQILCVATNDSWFKESKQLEQHLRHSVLRAIELNRYILISANTGISAIIDNKGTILNTIEKSTSGYLTGTANLINNRTLYSYCGNIPILTFCIFIISFQFLKSKYLYKKC
ncbi:MAG: apolipoprotein N-acyltransferase [Clostridium sp.]|nr:apolipoprotein N-acyltransferase [Clostridium sp.]